MREYMKKFIIWIIIYISLYIASFIGYFCFSQFTYSEFNPFWSIDEFFEMCWLFAGIVFVQCFFLCLGYYLIPKWKPYKHYFDKTDSPYGQEYQPKRKYHTEWKKRAYVMFLKRKVVKIKLFGLFTIYKKEE